MENMKNYVPVEQFYRDKSVFVTGGTGFLGKVLVEKLLWSCPGIENVYLLIRQKKHHEDIFERLQIMLSTSVFDRLRKRQPLDLLKMIPIKGDITQPLLGISTHDISVLSQKISVVFHVAATVKFNGDLRTAVNINVVGTKNVVEFCHHMSKLQAFIHISTAYSNCERQYINEVVYPASHDVKEIMESVQNMDDNALEKLTPRILGNQPNTYTFTKALAENILVKESSDLPLAIVRPSIVVASMEEPVPGWIDNWYGLTGVVIGVTRGVIHTLFCDGNIVADLIPVDMVANLTICAAWRIATNEPPGSFRVYNHCSGQENPVSWGKFTDRALINARKYPLQGALYPKVFLIAQRTLYFLFTLLLETLPAYVLDAFYRLSGRKPIFVQTNKKLKKLKHHIHYFSSHEWCFKDDNVKDLHNLLQDEKDKKTFSFDVRKIDWSAYLERYYLGIRHYLLNES